MTRTTESSAIVDVVLPEPSEALVEFAERQIAAAVEESATPVLHARVRVFRHSDPAAPQPVLARAVLVMPLHLVRAEVSGASEQEALEALHDRLVAQLERRPGEPPTARAPYLERPAAERRLIMHDSIVPTTCDLDAAAVDMAAMDYWFYLFTEVGSGQDSVLVHTPAGYRLAQVAPDPEMLSPYALPVQLVDEPAPLFSVQDAVEQLERSGEPYLFFLDTERICGALVYRRFDGHYGLVLPATRRGAEN